jgi:serine/threonine-protein kinase PknG
VRASGPIAPDEAIAYMLAVLPALGHLHRSGLLFCDFKLDNVIRTRDALKLIDLGGVYRSDDPGGPVYGTAGYQAPEIATMGPSAPSDLYTVGRTLMLLCIDLRGYQSTYVHSLPPAGDVPVFTEFDSLYRVLEKATALDPDDRFQTADEMADQLVGVLCEVVARREGSAPSRPSTLFSADLRARPDRPDYERLPVPQVDSADPASGFLATLSAALPADVVRQLREAPDQTVEVRLRLAKELMAVGEADEADRVLDAIVADDAWEWRAAWLRGVGELARGRPERAVAPFHDVYLAVPGELAPKLALGVAYESARDFASARPWYDIVSRTDPSYTNAAFGLARCCLAQGDRDGALDAYARVEERSSTYTDARVAIVQCLTEENGPPAVGADLVTADAILGEIDVDARQHAILEARLLIAALAHVDANGVAPDTGARVVGRPLEDRELRIGLEAAYRRLARLAPNANERIELVDAANHVRPRTWT